MQQLNLNTSPGAFQTAWSQAFNDYGATTAGHWHRAAQELQQLATTYPQFKGVNAYLAYAQQQAKTEKVTATPTTTPTPSPSSSSSFLSNNWPLLAGGVLVVLAIVFFGALIVRSRAKKPALAKSKQSYGAPPNNSYPYPSPVNQAAPPVRALPQTPPQGQQAYSPPPPNIARPSIPYGAPSASQSPVWPDPSASRPPAPAWPASSTPQQSLPRQSNSYAPGASGTSNTAGDRTQIAVHWPCGHMNIPGARFCSKCGEPAPQSPPPMRRYEQ